MDFAAENLMRLRELGAIARLLDQEATPEHQLQGVGHKHRRFGLA